MWTTPPSAPLPHTLDPPPWTTSICSIDWSGIRFQYTQPPNGSLIGTPSSSTRARLVPLGPCRGAHHGLESRRRRVLLRGRGRGGQEEADRHDRRAHGHSRPSANFRGTSTTLSTARAPRWAGAKVQFFTAPAAAWSRTAWPEEDATLTSTTRPFAPTRTERTTRPSSRCARAAAGYGGRGVFRYAAGTSGCGEARISIGARRMTSAADAASGAVTKPSATRTRPRVVNGGHYTSTRGLRAACVAC